jgi:hypothetical protein
VHLDHPVAVRVLDVLADDGFPFVVTELVEAPDLAEVVASEGPFPPARAAALGLELLDVLAAAHAGGLVHRDVHPSNVLLVEGAGPRLADFGVASLVDDPKVTTSGEASVPSYLAPEQTGAAGASAAADLWSLAATLYFAVEGEPPFDGEDPVATIDAIVHLPPRPARRAGSLQPFFDALLVKDPVARAGEDRARSLLTAAAGGEADDSAFLPPPLAAPPPWTTADDGVLDDPPPVGMADASAPAPPAGDGAAEPDTGTSADDVAVTTIREPWFFELPVESVPPPPLPEPTAGPPAPPVDTGPRRLPRGFWVTVLAVLTGLVMIALLTTGGRQLRPSRPSVADRAGVAPAAAWVSYTDEATGFSVRYPSDWSIRRTGTQTYFVDPANNAYLEVDHQQPPAASPLVAWQDLEKTFAAQHPTYEKVQLEPSTFQGFPAAVWEFTYTDGGNALHSVDLGFTTDRYGFALLFQTRATDWSRLGPVFESFKTGFKAPA